MEEQRKLFLASASASRQKLLAEARIPFVVIEQTCDERAVQKPGPVEEVVQHLASCKAAAAILPALPVFSSDSPIFVLAADTFVSDLQGNLYGKQPDYQSAVAVLRQLRNGARVTTGFCCQKIVNGRIVDQVVQAVGATIELSFTEKHIAYYLAGRPDYMHIAGALAIEEFGAQFVRAVYGSYTAVLGLPMAEVREALEKVGFFD